MPDRSLREDQELSVDMAKKIVEDFLALINEQPQLLELIGQQLGQGEGTTLGTGERSEESREEAVAQHPVGERGMDRYGFRAEDYLSTAKTFTEGKKKFRVTKMKNLFIEIYIIYYNFHT